MKVYAIACMLVFTNMLVWSQGNTPLDSSAVLSMKADTNKVNALLSLSNEAIKVDFKKAKKY